MVTEEELNRDKESNDLRNERVGIERKVLENLQEQNNITSDIVSQLRFEKAERSEIRSITRDLNKIAQDNYDLSLSNIGSLKSTLKIETDRESALRRQRRLEDLSQKFLEDALTLTGKEQEKRFDLAVSLEQQAKQAEALAAELEVVAEESKEIADNLAVKGFNVTEDIIGAIPGLRQFKGTFTDAANSAKAIAAGGGNASKAFAAGAKSIASAAKSALPLLIFTQLVKAFTQLDESSGKIAKNLGISYDQALALNKEFTGIAVTSGNIFVTTQNLGEAFVSINDALGTNSSLSEDLLITQTELVKQAGYSVEAATQIAALSLATGQSSKDITTEFLGQVTLLNAQNNLALNEKTLLESIAKTSKGTLATFSAQPKALAQAAFEAKKLGLELAQVEKIADGLLDIEQSLTSEFEAEVISGRQLNLERARYFALTNDLAGVAKELAAQDITRASFAKANRIEQDAIAASLGMSRDEMGEMLLEQEALTKLSGIQGATAQERFNNLVKEVGLEEAKRRIGDETLSNQLASVNTQEKFAQIVSKLQEVFVQVVTPLMPLLSLAGKIIAFIAPILPTLTALAGFLTGNPFLVVAGGAAIYSQIQGVGDGMAPASKGPFTITDSYGATAITAKGDSLAVSPNIRRDDRNNGTIIDYDKLAEAIAKGAEKGTSRATIVAYLNGDRVSTQIQTPLAVNTRKYST